MYLMKTHLRDIHGAEISKLFFIIWRWFHIYLHNDVLAGILAMNKQEYWNKDDTLQSNSRFILVIQNMTYAEWISLNRQKGQVQDIALIYRDILFIYVLLLYERVSDQYISSEIQNLCTLIQILVEICALGEGMYMMERTDLTVL